MKEKIKEFCKEHKTAIVAASGIIIGGAIIAIGFSKRSVRIIEEVQELSKDEIIKFLEETTDPTVKYAIFKETLEDVFQVVPL